MFQLPLLRCRVLKVRELEGRTRQGLINIEMTNLLEYAVTAWAVSTDSRLQAVLIVVEKPAFAGCSCRAATRSSVVSETMVSAVGLE